MSSDVGDISGYGFLPQTYRSANGVVLNAKMDRVLILVRVRLQSRQYVHIDAGISCVAKRG